MRSYTLRVGIRKVKIESNAKAGLPWGGSGGHEGKKGVTCVRAYVKMIHFNRELVTFKNGT